MSWAHDAIRSDVGGEAQRPQLLVVCGTEDIQQRPETITDTSAIGLPVSDSCVVDAQAAPDLGLTQASPQAQIPDEGSSSLEHGYLRYGGMLACLRNVGKAETGRSQ